MTIGTNIRNLRLKRKMTQTELAKQAGIGRSYMCEIESGRKTPGIMRLLEIATVLKVSIHKLL